MPARKIEVVIVGDSRSLQAALGKSSAQLTGFARTANKLGNQMTTTGRTLTRNVTLPIAALGAVATKMAFDYDTAITHVQALTGASAKQTQAWSEQLLKLGPKIGQSPQQLAEALYFVASSGAKVNQVLPITTAAAKDAAAGMGDAETVAQLLTSAINAYGPKALSAAHASDVLTAAVKVGKAEPADLAESLGRVIPIAQKMGVTFDESAALVATLTNTGLDASEAVTGLSGTLTALIKPTAAGREELKKVGITMDDVRKEVSQKGLLATLLDLKDAFGGNVDQMGRFFQNRRAMVAFLALTGQNAKSAAENVNLVAHSTGAASKAFKTASEGPQARFNREMAKLDATAIKIGNDLLPPLLDVLGAVGKLADKFSHLSDTEQHAIEIGAGIAALAGPALTVGGNLLKLGVALRLISRTAPVAATGMAEVEAAAAGSTVAMGPLLPLVVGLAAGYELWSHRTKTHVTVSGNFLKAQQQLNQVIATGQMSVDGWQGVIKTATSRASGLQGALNKLRDSGVPGVSKAVSGQAKQNLQTFIGQMRAVAAQTDAASHDTADFGAAARRQYAHISALAKTTADLAAAMHSVPDIKQVRLIVDIVAHLQTEALAPGMGPESTRQGPGGHYHPPAVKGPASGTGQGGGKAVGGLVRAGMSYTVGESRPERLIMFPGGGGYVVPGDGSGRGKHEIVITNWREGRGYMLETANVAVGADSARRKQRQRMGG